jgi:hypothetical protein
MPSGQKLILLHWKAEIIAAVVEANFADSETFDSVTVSSDNYKNLISSHYGT